MPCDTNHQNASRHIPEGGTERGGALGAEGRERLRGHYSEGPPKAVPFAVTFGSPDTSR